MYRHGRARRSKFRRRSLAVAAAALVVDWPITNRVDNKRGRIASALSAIAAEEGRPIYKFSTDSPLRTTTGNLECLALFAGQIAGAIEAIPSAGGRVGEIVSAARATLERLQRVGTATV